MRRKYLYLLLLLLSHRSFGQKTVIISKDSNSILLENYIDIIDNITFKFPKKWDTTIHSKKFDGNFEFTAFEPAVYGGRKYLPNIVFSRSLVDMPIDTLLSLAKLQLRRTDLKKSFLEEKISKNKNNISYAMLKCLTPLYNIQLSTIDIYFRKGKYAYILVFSKDSTDSIKYDSVWDEVVSSIQFTE